MTAGSNNANPEPVSLLHERALPLESEAVPEEDYDYKRLQREFEDEPRLTPGVIGPNFNNLPALGFTVVKDEAGQKTVLVPSTRAINTFVEEHNPGGYTFADVSGYVYADDLLTMYANKQLPNSNLFETYWEELNLSDWHFQCQ